jgi:23S rRNA (cytosine1962-C5)-methyltransferase
VFSGALAGVPPALQDGDLVCVASSSGEPLAVGQYYSGTIAVRVLAFGAAVIDQAFWNSRLLTAQNLRKRLGFVGNLSTTCYRLCHGEGDGVPGLIIDVYGDAAVVHYHSIGMWKVRSELLTALQALEIKFSTVFERRVFEDDPHGAFAVGDAVGGVCLENGLKFEVDWVRGQKTGFFLDQRDNRAMVKRFSEGRRVLNAFSYTGGFSVAALAGGAKYVDTVDSSKSALQLADKNVAHNFSSVDHKSIDADCMKFLTNFARDYDLIVLDPPAFAKHRRHMDEAAKGYRKINRLAMERILPGGLLFTFSCSQAIDKEHFQKLAFEAALQAKREVKILARLSQPADHPVSVFHPEGEYLKGLLLAVE